MSAPKKSASKKRLLWEALPANTQADIERLADGQVVAAKNCTGGFSPGLASRLDLAGGRQVFVKAMDAVEWPDQATHYRAEAFVSQSLPPNVPAPKLLGWSDDGRWVALVFECIDGGEPDLRRSRSDAFRIAAALDDLATSLTPSPIHVPSDHPRLGGWADLAMDPERLARLPAAHPWAADHLGTLIELENAGLAAARGDTLVHFDAYPHNILLTQQSRALRRLAACTTRGSIPRPDHVRVQRCGRWDRPRSAHSRSGSNSWPGSARHRRRPRRLCRFLRRRQSVATRSGSGADHCGQGRARLGGDHLAPTPPRWSLDRAVKRRHAGTIAW